MLSGIRLENFKCFRSQHISFRPLTLLTGLNAMGKSTAVQALLLLRQSIGKGLLPGRGLLLNGPDVRLGIAEDVLYQGAERDEIGIAIEDSEGQGAWRFAYQVQFDDVLPVVEEPRATPKISSLVGEMHFLSAERIGPRALYDVSFHEVRQRHDMGADARYGVAYLDSVESLPVSEKLRHANAADERIRSQVAAWLSEITPGTQLRTSPYPELNRVTLGVGFESGRARSRYFSPQNVGFGLSYVLPVIVAVLASPAGTTVIVENPEAHLNPRGQTAMGRMLALGAAAGLQVIVETHSDHILNGCRISVKDKLIDPDAVAIHFFGRSVRDDVFEHFVDSIQIDERGRIDHWPDGFFDEIERSLNELLE